MRLTSVIALAFCLIGCVKPESPSATAVVVADTGRVGATGAVVVPDTGLLGASEAQEQGAVTRTSNEYFRQVTDIPALPACGGAAEVRCIADTTRANDECCTGDVVASWLLVLQASDSFEVFVGPGGPQRRADAAITMQQIGRARAFQEHDVNTASYMRYRFPEAGTYTLHVGVPSPLDENTVTVPYDLRIRRPAGNEWRSEAPTLAVEADDDARIFAFPSRHLEHGASKDQFQMRPGIYRVLAPTTDSVFVCAGQCTSLIPIWMGAGNATVRF